MNADFPENPDFDWSTCTFDGARLAHHRSFAALPFAEKMAQIDAMCITGLTFLESRKRRGLPYIDPYTKQLVRPSPSGEGADSSAP